MRSRWSRFLVAVGYVGLLIGALDPLEGSIVILAGSIVLVFGTALGRLPQHLLRTRLSACLLIAAGVAALWGLSTAGGFGGETGLSGWWGLLIFPYFVGWSSSVWGTGVPRWVTATGIAVGIWYLVLVGLAWIRTGSTGVALVLGVIGLLTMGGCIYRLNKGSGEQAQ